MLKDREWIASHIPHQGAMCLLDEVSFWNADRVRCVSRSHHSADNPLRAYGRLGAACAIELAAQAMAVHGALLAPPRPRGIAIGGIAIGGIAIGVLASLRNVSFRVARIDDIQDDLIATATRLSGDESTAMYKFEVLAGTLVLVKGQAIVTCKHDDMFGHEFQENP